MRRQLACLLASAMLFSLTACGGTPSDQDLSAPSESGQAAETSEPGPSGDLAAERPNAESPEEMPGQPQPSGEEQQAPAQPPAGDDDGNRSILIAYFTWADNTVVASASTLPGSSTTVLSAQVK